MNDIVLETRTLNKYFHEPVEFHVLKDIDVTIHKGEFVSMIGKEWFGEVHASVLPEHHGQRLQRGGAYHG